MSAKKRVSLWWLIPVSAIVLVALTLSACGAPSPTPVPTPTVVPEVLASKPEDVVGVWLLDAGSEGEFHFEYTKEGTFSTTAVSGPHKGGTFDAGKFWFEGTQLKFESSEGCLTAQGDRKPCIGAYQVYVTKQGDKPALKFVVVEDQFADRKFVLRSGKWSFLTPTATPIPTVASTPAPTATPTPTSVSISAVVLGMVERMNAGDAEGSLAYFADDAMVYLMGFPPTGIEVYRGKEQIRTLWEDSVSNHFQWEVEITQVSGDEVYVRAKTWHDFTRDLGVAPLEYSDVYEVKDGKIITYGSWLTEESLARFRPAFAEVMPPELPATPPSDLPVSKMTVTIARGTCTTDSPMTLQAGEVTVTLDVQDQDNSLYALTLFNLDPGKDFLDLMAATVGMPPSWVDMLLFEELGPGKSETYSFTVEEGPVYLICWSKPPDLPIGNAGPFEVKQ